jgi:hypothetical protein
MRIKYDVKQGHNIIHTICRVNFQTYDLKRKGLYYTLSTRVSDPSSELGPPPPPPQASVSPPLDPWRTSQL